MKKSLEILKRIFLPWSQESILYEATARCNLRCVHCYNVWKDGVGYETEELDTEGAKDLIRRACVQTRCRQFTFTGGEPTLREDLEELVRTAAGYCRHVSLITNGTMLEEERVKSLIKAGVSLFELPLNSDQREMHNRMAGGMDCFGKVTRAAADIRYHGAHLAFVFVGTKLNIEHWKGALELGIALGAMGFLFNRYNAGGECHGRPEVLIPSVEQVREGLATAQAYARQYGVGIGASIAIPPCLIDTGEFPDVGFGFCAAGTERAYYTLDPTGNVRPCNHTPTVLGSLLEQPFREIVKSPKLKAFMAARPELCRGCRLEGECQGGCKAAAEACYGDLCGTEPFLRLHQTQIRKVI